MLGFQKSFSRDSTVQFSRQFNHPLPQVADGLQPEGVAFHPVGMAAPVRAAEMGGSAGRR